MAARILGFGLAPQAKELGYSVLSEFFDGTHEDALIEYANEDVILVCSAEKFNNAGVFEFGVFTRQDGGNNS